MSDDVRKAWTFPAIVTIDPSGKVKICDYGTGKLMLETEYQPYRYFVRSGASLVHVVDTPEEAMKLAQGLGDWSIEKRAK